MNDAHLHLAINHRPIIGLISGFGVLLGGRLIRSEMTMRVALWLLAARGLLRSRPNPAAGFTTRQFNASNSQA